MTRKNHAEADDLLADPFRERIRMISRPPMQLLGGRFSFRSDSRELLGLVDWAYADLPAHRLSAVPPRLTVNLLLGTDAGRRPAGRSEPPPLSMFSGAGALAAASIPSNFVVMSPSGAAALVAVSREMLRFPYHTRYELIEFTVFTLAARCQGLVPLHAACVGHGGRGVLLMGASGAGKSTLTLHCLLQGLDMLSEDSVFVEPGRMLATGAANFLHVRSDSLRWLGKSRDAAAIRKSPVIRRRSGVRKFEVDLRQGEYALAASPLEIGAIVFLSPQAARAGALLRRLSKPELSAKLTADQAYASNLPEWAAFQKNASTVRAFELRRGRHPLEAVEVLRALLEANPMGNRADMVKALAQEPRARHARSRGASGGR